MKFKRLFFDIEVSPNLGFFWNTGRKVPIDYDMIVEERAVICICYRWDGQKKIYSLQWNRGNDKQMLRKFIKIMDEADEVIGHNSDNFDIKWLRTRCMFHYLPMLPVYQSVDTYKHSKNSFRLNSNRLDYIGKYTGVGGKRPTKLSLWKDIVLRNSKRAMKYMVLYCKDDVELVQNVFNRFKPYIKSKTHVGVLIGQSKISCPECGGQCKRNGIRVSAAGSKRQQLTCNSCGKYHTVPFNPHI